MSLSVTIALMIVLIMPDGEQRKLTIEQPNMPTCFEQAWTFMQRSPADFNAIAIGAGCIHHPNGREH